MTRIKFVSLNGDHEKVRQNSSVLEGEKRGRRRRITPSNLELVQNIITATTSFGCFRFAQKPKLDFEWLIEGTYIYLPTTRYGDLI